jgi:hypothetical protein
MNYLKIHDNIILNAKNRQIEDNIYYERHHIIPKCMGGDNSIENLVKLTAREHFIIHWLLTLINPKENSLKFAFWNMCQRGHSSNNRYVPSSRIYAWGRSQLKGIHKPEGFQSGVKNTFYGKKHSEESLQKISESMKNRVFSEEHRRKLSESAKKRKGNKPCKFKGMKYEDYMDPEKAAELRKKSSENAKRPMSEATKKKISDSTKGRLLGPMSDTHIKNLKIAFIERDKKRTRLAQEKNINILDEFLISKVTEENVNYARRIYQRVKCYGINMKKYDELLLMFKEIEFNRRSNRNK